MSPANKHAEQQAPCDQPQLWILRTTRPDGTFTQGTAGGVWKVMLPFLRKEREENYRSGSGNTLKLMKVSDGTPALQIYAP